jgi:multimeric flavodoxin WrbA
MKAVIFDGAKEGDLTIKALEKTIFDKLTEKGWEVEPIELRNTQIANCIGCFGCWVKTPGTCVINDGGRETTRKAIQSDLLVWLTPVTFGGYSSELKKALDRIIPILLPYFQSYRGQIHHKMRYSKYPKLLVIGVQEPGVDYKETFMALAERNSLNFRPPAHAVAVFQRDKEPETIPVFVEEQLKQVEIIS